MGEAVPGGRYIGVNGKPHDANGKLIVDPDPVVETHEPQTSDDDGKGVIKKAEDGSPAPDAETKKSKTKAVNDNR